MSIPTRIFFIVALLLLAFIAAIIFNHNIGQHFLFLQNSSAEHFDTEKLHLATKENSDNTTKLSDTSANKNAASAITEKKQNEAIYNDWLKKHGHLQSAENDYNSYDSETLKKLAFNGDEIAVNKLGQIYWREQGKKAAIDFYHEAATRGSTAALNDLSGVVSASDYSNAPIPELKKSAALEILALNEVAAMRGDRTYNVISNIGNYSNFDRDNIVINEDDIKKIKARAQDIYNQLQNKRIELGLGPFDNTVPEVVTHYFDDMEKSFIKNREDANQIKQNHQ